jgi:quercetin dioxygenase-like cupin family protein
MKAEAAGTVLLLWFALGLGLAGHAQSQAQTPANQAVELDQEPHHHLVYANDDLRIYDVVVPPHESTLLHQHDNDYIYVVLGDSEFTAQVPGQPAVQAQLPDGSVRFAKGGFAHVLTNDSNQPFRNITIVLLNPKVTARGCACSGNPADAVCACPNAPPPPANWTLRIGQVQLGEVTLAPGAGIVDNSTKTTRFLVAVTPLDMLDVTIHEPRGIKVRLAAGRFHWFSPGKQELQNIGTQPIRFVSVAF